MLYCNEDEAHVVLHLDEISEVSALHFLAINYLNSFAIICFLLLTYTEGQYV